MKIVKNNYSQLNLIKMTTTQLVYFSPTGTTFKILDTIAKGLNYEILDSINLTNQLTRQNSNFEVKGDIILFGVPVYRSRVPSFIRPILEKIKGEGKWAVPIVVYGHVRAGESLDELLGILKNQGFNILASAAFIGEHSYTNQKLPLAKGRPDQDDLKIATDFGTQVSQKFERTPKEIILSGEIIPVRIGFSEQGGSSSVEFSDVDVHKCVHWTTDCIECYNSCPMNAIDPNTMEINHELCISCFACVRACPYNARDIKFKNSWIFEKFYSFIDPKKTPECFLN